MELEIKKYKKMLKKEFPTNTPLVLITERYQRNHEFRMAVLAGLKEDLEVAKTKRTKKAEAGDRGLTYYRENCGAEVINIIDSLHHNNPQYDSFRLLLKVRKECRKRFAGDVSCVWGEIKKALDDLECIDTKAGLINLVSKMEALRLEQAEFHAENNLVGGVGVLPPPMQDREAIMHLRARLDSDSKELAGLITKLDKRTPDLNTWVAVEEYCHWFCSKNVSNVNKRARTQEQSAPSASTGATVAPPTAHIAAAASATAAAAAAAYAAEAADASAFYGQQLMQLQQVDPYYPAGYRPQAFPTRGGYRGPGKSAYSPRGMPAGYEEQGGQQPPPPAGVCFNFWRFGPHGCPYGAACRYIHDSPTLAHTGGGGGPAAAPPSANNDKKSTTG
jgi:hypothetical protein